MYLTPTFLFYIPTIVLGVIAIGSMIAYIVGLDIAGLRPAYFVVSGVVFLATLISCCVAGVWAAGAQATQLQQQADETYNVHLTSAQAGELLFGDRDWITLKTQGDVLIQQRVHLDNDGTGRWLLTALGNTRAVKITAHHELSKVS